MFYLVAELDSNVYWRYNFNSICDTKQLIEYIVMDIEPIKHKNRKIFPGQGAISNKVSSPSEIFRQQYAYLSLCNIIFLKGIFLIT